MIYPVIFLFILALSTCQAVQPLPPNFINVTGCLYATSKSGQYKVSFPDRPEGQNGVFTEANYEGSTCITKDHPGKLMMTYDMDKDNNFNSMSLEMELKQNSNYYWSVGKTILKIVPTNKALFPETTLEMYSSDDIYAPSDYSYSCSVFSLSNFPKSGQPKITVTLRRFQFQPFHEPDNRIFAVSRDCSHWLTLPQIMGFLLILFMVSTVFMGAYLLIELGSHSSDLRFSKQGGMLMNQAQLDATKAD